MFFPEGVCKMFHVRKKVNWIIGYLTTLLFILVLSSGCVSTARQTPGTQGAPAPPGQVSPEGKLNLALYYVKMTENDAYLVREVHQVPPTGEAAKVAVEELISVNPSTPGAARLLPADTKVRSVAIKDGLATVDFSKEALRANVGALGEAMGIQSIVNTLAELPGVQKVSFMVEGKVDEEAIDWWGHVGLYTQPFSKDVSKVYEPAIWVTAPAPGQKVTTPLVVRGSAMVFEGTVNARLLDESGKVLAEGYGTATEGAPGRGDFEISLPFTASAPGGGKLAVFWISPKDGKDMDEVTVPVAW